MMSFEEVCRLVEEAFEREWQAAGELGRMEKLEREKKAIMGFDDDVAWYKERISEIVVAENCGNGEFPPWYRSLEEGVFNELYGLAGLAPWAYDEKEEYVLSPSAKLIGDRLYCFIDGKSRLQPQTIGKRRREQLKRALLLASPRERLENGFHEVYLRNGIRITIYSGERTKEGQDVMVFRKYIMKDLTFEKLAELGTIPHEAIPLFRVMVRLGFNVIFSGPVRTGKTTFMQVWQQCEDPELEGLAIATDPETPWHELMPQVPVMQLVADGKLLEIITKSILRGDNDYVLLEEMRDAQAYNIALKITSSGTRRCKATVHTGDPVNLPFKIASEIFSEYGGDMRGIILQIFTNFNYVFEFFTVESNRSLKKLKGIWEYCYDPETDRPEVYRICRYDPQSGVWQWQFHIGEDKKEAGSLRPDDFLEMEGIMRELEKRNPLTERKVIYPRYYKPAYAITAEGNYND